MSSKPERVTFDTTNYTLLLSVDHEDVANCVVDLHEESLAKDLHRKEEFHITVIGFRLGTHIKEKYAHVPQENRSAIENGIEVLAHSIDWSFTYSGMRSLYIEKEYRNKSGQKELRKSIVQLLAMPGMNDFYRELNDVFGTTFEIPPPHVTLFVGADNQGIGIDSEAALAALHPKEIF